MNIFPRLFERSGNGKSFKLISASTKFGSSRRLCPRVARSEMSLAVATLYLLLYVFQQQQQQQQQQQRQQALFA